MISSLEFRAMGCRIEIQLDHPTGRPVPKVFSQMPETFEVWEACLSRFRDDSELCLLNRSAGTPVQVSEVLWQVLQAARMAEAQSDGLVSAAVLQAVLAAGYTVSFDRLAPGSAAQPESTTGNVAVGQPARSLAEIRLDAQTRSACLPWGMQLDFGGVAKGWAAHRAMQLLEPYGPALVEAGGDLALGGFRRDGQPWMISVKDPRSPGDALGVMRLGRGGVATSGIDRRRWQQGGQWRHHIIDPRTGLPAVTDVLAATVVASNVLEAEMAAKTILILGSRAGMEWLASRPACAALLVLQDGALISSAALRPLVAAFNQREVARKSNEHGPI